MKFYSDVRYKPKTLDSYSLGNLKQTICAIQGRRNRIQFTGANLPPPSPAFARNIQFSMEFFDLF